MFYDRIAEHDLKAVIRKLAKIGGVANDGLDVLILLFFRDEVQAADMDIRSLCPASVFPK